MKDALRCYICGEPLPDDFVLATMSEETDRVFVLHTKCSKQLESGTTIIAVTTTTDDVKRLDWLFDYYKTFLGETMTRASIDAAMKEGRNE